MTADTAYGPPKWHINCRINICPFYPLKFYSYIWEKEMQTKRQVAASEKVLLATDSLPQTPAAGQVGLNGSQELEIQSSCKNLSPWASRIPQTSWNPESVLTGNWSPGLEPRAGVRYQIIRHGTWLAGWLVGFPQFSFVGIRIHPSSFPSFLLIYPPLPFLVFISWSSSLLCTVHLYDYVHLCFFIGTYHLNCLQNC